MSSPREQETLRNKERMLVMKKSLRMLPKTKTDNPKHVETTQKNNKNKPVVSASKKLIPSQQHQEKYNQTHETLEANETMDRDEKEQEHPTIFVSIPSYRDEECPKTIEDLFKKAKYPHRVFVGCCEQNNPEDISADKLSADVSRRYGPQIRIMKIPSSSAKGPMYARHLIEKHLYQNEEYCLNIDSHMLFVPHWDTVLLSELEKCSSPKPILTCYPTDFDRTHRNVIPTTNPSYLCFRDFYPKNGFLEQDRVFLSGRPKNPLVSLFWAAGFNFCRSEAMKECPYDPYCKYVFLGEEVSMALRLYTHGWDFFSPSSMHCFHVTTREYRPTFWELFHRSKGIVNEETSALRKQMESKGVLRLQKLLISDEGLEAPFGCGQVRSRDDYEKFIGVNFKTKQHTERAKLGLSPNPSGEELMYKRRSSTPIVKNNSSNSHSNTHSNSHSQVNAKRKS